MNDTASPKEPGIRIRTLSDSDVPRWEEFVDRCSEATFFHRAGWKEVIERAFSHRTFFLFAERDDRIEGVLPLAQIRSRLFGNVLVSTPFCVYGGIAADSREACTALEKAGCDLADRLQVDSLEMRNIAPRRPGWPAKSLYVTFRKAIDPDPEVNLKAIPRKQRAMVRKGIEAGLQADFDEGVDRVHRVYAESVRNLGTPVFSKNYFRILREVFADACEVLMITHEGKDIAGVLSFYFRDQVLPYYGGSIADARALKGNDFMYWELMRRAAERGIRVFDYGRSKEGTGSYSFKKNWGFVPEPLHYEYYLVRSESIPEVNPNNPKYRYFIEAWKRLPVSVTNLIGPMIVRNLG